MSEAALSRSEKKKRRLPQINPVYIVLAVLLIAIVIQNVSFLEPQGYMNFLKRSAPLAILAAGSVFVIVAGGFDLSVGALITLTVIGSSMLLNNNPDATWWVILLMLGLGVLVGCINGLIVCYLRVPSLIATLGMMITLNGAALMWSGGSPRGYLPDSFRFFGRFNFQDVPIFQLLPVAVIILIVLGFALYWLMHRTNFGRMVHAIGDNPRAAQLAGVPVERVRILAFVVSSVSAVIAGVMLGGFAGVSTDVGSGYELQAITAAVLGGAQLLGGRGSVPAAIAGALTLQAIFTLLNFLGLPKPVRDVVQGVILIAAVALAMYRRKKTGR
ncbi:ABC transporter permease [Paradevosia shaoguanensis]|uniref:Autoinducer 2 import system permease protein LsrD n=1 Tax=Paradevosia shaoguanensis TaxID=1335043 RepID=A0AA41QKG2_9HYPH|nr:ABC transporter permease [Paradevosia shaoguanensis]MCF1741339.1 ABC transporter permease [Paradevosia shaoguanensis]MCI0125822.1 ABC transporter permease [Paradevosia shaoguanensis]CDP51172.1 Ribose ABC transport system, permease protein RbsC [Devosia sp. DBB001]